MQKNNLTKQLVLIGGGHANIQVLKKLCMNTFIGLNTILISDRYDAVYSGLTPAFLQNQIGKKDISIDLQRLCFNAGATFINDSIVSLDASNQFIELEKNPGISYDLLSINTGSISKKSKIKKHIRSICIPVKPISTFVDQIEKIDHLVFKEKKKYLTIIGKGIAGYEISFSLSQRYKDQVKITIVGSNDIKEQSINQITKKKLKYISKKLGINEKNGIVKEIGYKNISLINEELIRSDINFLSTGVSAPKWLDSSIIKRDKFGFALINEYLQCQNYKNIFITGDIASSDINPRPKSGVMAVRQGESLKENIFLKLQGKTLFKHTPQKNWLSIVNTFQKNALINYYYFSYHGRWPWKLKFLIDKKFMGKFKFPNQNKMNKKIKYLRDINKNNSDIMHCQGCGSKVSKITLIDYLNKKKLNFKLEDSTIIKNKSNKILQTIDHIKLFSSFNPYDFGIISYLHSQNDILSGGGKEKSFSVSLGLPFSNGVIEKFYMDYFMEGIISQAKKYKSKIVSGHSYYSFEPGITISMNGDIENKISKNFAKKDDLIYLSKPIGTGYLLATYFKNSDLMTIKDFQNLIKWLKTSNYQAYVLAKKYKSRVITDISGFGLASHLGDICKLSNLTAEINLNNNVFINSNNEILNNFKSTGFQNNFNAVSNYVEIKNKKLENILYDPQTNGPLLIILKKEFKDPFEKDFISIYKREPILLGKFKRFIKNYINIK